MSKGNKRGRNGKIKPVIYDFFKDCANILEETTQDQFWVDKFNDCSTGKFPRGFSYNDGHIHYKKGKILRIPNNSYDAVRNVIEFFHLNGGIFSPTEEKNYERPTALLENFSWKKISKQTQFCAKSFFVDKKKVELNLSREETEQLRKVVDSGISKRFFANENIKFNGNCIFEIEGLCYDSENRKFFINSSIKPAPIRSCSRSKKKASEDTTEIKKDTIFKSGSNWNKYLEMVVVKKLDKCSRKNNDEEVENGSALASVELSDIQSDED